MLNLLFGPPRAASYDSDGWPVSMGTRVRTTAGVVVDENLALVLSSVFCATRVICETVAGLPLFTYRRLPQDDREFALGNPLFDLLHSEPNPFMPSNPFREGRTMHQVNWGNGFAEIEWDSFARDPRTRVLALWPIHAGRVRPLTRQGHADLYDGGYRYLVRNDDNSEVALKPDEMLHFPGVFPEDGIWGKGVIRHARESIGFSLATERHGAAYFGGGAQPKGVMTMPGMKDPEARRQYRKEWKEVHTAQTSEIAILPVDAKYQPITIGNEDSQFLQTRQHNVTEIARWYRIPPHKIMDLSRATFSNIEHQSIDFVTDAILPWLRRQEAQYQHKLILPRDRGQYFVEHQLAGLLRGDLASRMAAYQVALMNGIMTLNEVRRLENLNSIGPAGDQHFVQLNMTTVERLAAGDSGPGRANGMDGPDAAKTFDEWTKWAAARLAGEKSAKALLPAPPSASPANPPASADDAKSAGEGLGQVQPLDLAAPAADAENTGSGDVGSKSTRQDAPGSPISASGGPEVPPPAASADPPAGSTLQVPRAAIRAAVVDALARGFTKIAHALKREKAQVTDAGEWLDAFETRHAEAIQDALEPVAQVLAAECGGQGLRRQLFQRARGNLAAALDNMTRDQLDAYLTDWPRTAAGRLADELMETKP